MCKPNFSIICPLYNKERFISETIESVLRQTEPNWELLIVDDDSTDGSLEIARTYASRDNRIRVIERKFTSNLRGANLCRNIGIREARSDYLIFLDADDVLMPYCLAQRKEWVERFPDHNLYVFNVAYWRSSDNKPFSRKYPTFIERLRFYCSQDKKLHFLKRFLSFDLPWHTSGPVWNKSLITDVGGFNGTLQRLQDPELHIRALLCESTRVKYLKPKTKYDILHRKDTERVVWDKGTFFYKQIDSIKDFLPIITGLLLSSKNERLIGYLKGYLLFGETLVYRALRDERAEPQKMIEVLTSLYNNTDVPIVNSRYRLFLNIYRRSLKQGLIRFKIPGVLLYFYKTLI